MNTAIWFDLADDHGVLELHGSVTAPGPALELHIVIDSESDATIAWWMTDEGKWIGAAGVGDP